MESKIEQTKEGLTITVKEKEKHTIEELKQHLIDCLFAKECYEMSEVEIIKALLEDDKKVR